MEKNHWKKQFNYDYLGSYSLTQGQDMILTIEKTGREMVTGTNGTKEQLFVCHFKEDVKPMIMNRTNCKIIEKLYTPYIEDWIGIQIQVYTEQVKAFGEVVDALRIRMEKPNQKKPELTPSHERWNEIVKRLKSGVTIDKVEQHYTISEVNKTKLMEAAI